MDYIFLAAEGGPMNMIFIVAMIAVMYFFLIRPQQQKQKKQDTFVSDMKKGDKVVTTSGIHGKIMEMAEDNGLIVLLIDKNKGVNILIYEPSIEDSFFEGYKVCNDIKKFKETSDIILANRKSHKLNDVADKVFSRDVFGTD